jgi:hypothetical protein
MTSNALATICGTRTYSGLSFDPDVCDFRVSLIAAFSEFTRSTPSLTAEPAIDDSNFILNQMVQNQRRIQEISQQCNMIANLKAWEPLFELQKTLSVRRLLNVRQAKEYRLDAASRSSGGRGLGSDWFALNNQQIPSGRASIALGTKVDTGDWKDRATIAS